MAVRVIAGRPDRLVGFGETQIHAETTVFDVRASEVADPRPGDTITLDGATFIVQVSRAARTRTGSSGCSM